MQKGTQRLAVVTAAPHAPGVRLSNRRIPEPLQISDAELESLRDDVVLCRRTRALDWLDERRNLLRWADPGHSNTPAMLGYLVQWADEGGSLVEELAELEGRFPIADRGRLPLCSYLFLRFAGGVLNFLRDKPDGGDLDFVITVGASGCAGKDLLLLAHLWKAEVERRRGELDRASWHARQSGQMAVESGYPILAAKSQALEGLIMLDSGMPHAVELLRQAESVLTEPGDWPWLGRIQNGFGQAALDEGRYQSALDHFTHARGFFARAREPHRELGWAHFRTARAQRLIASRLAKNIDANAELRRRSLRAETAGALPSNCHSRQRLEELRSGAFSALSQSEALFRCVREARALDSVVLERGALWADCGDLQHAAQHARECFVSGQRNNDALLMAQARLLESRVENAYCEEGVGLDPTHHAQRACEYIKEALALALQCDARPPVKRRLLATAYVREGLLLLNEFFNNPEAARECCHSAGKYVNLSERDELWDEYQSLVSRALHSGSVDAKLRKWTEGLAEGKTFQQITDEFADLVIPAVWAREGKNTSRVVSKLSISPKKVRRILNRVGLKE
jgi:tetratricopeptide (TPR) repeat protein